MAIIRGILRAGRFDVLNTHSRRDIVIAAAGRLAGTPLIVRTRHLSNKVGSLWSYTRLPHCVTTVSDHVRQHLIDRGVPPDRVATVYCPSCCRRPWSIPRCAASWAWPRTTWWSAVAVMRATKGHKDLIDAIAPLMASRPKLHLVFVGAARRYSSRPRNTWRNWQDRIHLMGMRRDVPNLLAGFDLFALATQQEASGTVYVEAQASGLPVVGTDVGGVSEMFRDGETGILVPPKDPAALAAADAADR